MYNRQSIRLRNYDYAQSGYYFVTICTYERINMFGTIINNKIILNKFGIIIENVLKTLSTHHNVILDIYQIMPNHIHCILRIPICRGFARKTPTLFDKTQTNQNIYIISGSLSCIIRSFKSETSKQIHQNIEPNIIVWQRNYFEHIIRNETEYREIRKYIADNPKNWERDKNYND